MNKAKFTSGEWRVERFVNDKGFEIAFNDDGEVIADYVYAEPDAHLIAAAPEMYEMLNYLHQQLSGVEETLCWNEVGELLARARGEQ